MGTHNQTAVEVAANVAATTLTHTDTNTNNVNKHNEIKQQQQQQKEEEEQQQQEKEMKEDEKEEIYKSVEVEQQQNKEEEVEVVVDVEEEEEKETRYNLPKAREPPQVVIIPATQASTVATNAAKKIRRAFSMPRNPFRWSRKFKANISVDNNSGNGGNGNVNTRHTTTIISCVSGGRTNAGSTVSLNDSYQGNIGKDVATTPTEQAKINNNNNNNQQHYPDSNKMPQTPNSNNNNNNTNNKNIENNSGGGGNRIIRRSSLRKFLNRIAQHVSSTINVGANKNVNQIERMRNYSTDRVPPITNAGHQWPADQTPGVMGLKNHGNTCFMNAVLQCLSHTDILAEYFVLDQYKVDLKRRNKINSRKFGTKGELTEQLANVLKALWTCKNESDHSTSFKAVVDRYGSQFRSSTQHDAQEFLFWLLDKVHEDLNTASKRRYKSVKNSYGRPDEVIAAETLANHIRCNNSFVQAVFQAQFRSSLTCPRCKKQSNTFDPFHCISVQLPQLTQQSVYVSVVYMKQQPRQVKMGITVPAGSPIVALRERLQQATNIDSERMVLVDINNEGFSRVFYDTQPVATLQNLETIFCIEVPDVHKNTPPSATNNNSIEVAKTSIQPTASELLLLIACVKKKVENTEAIDEIKPAEAEKSIERFGSPFSMLVPRDCSFTELQKKILKEMASWLHPEVFTYSTPLSKMFQIRLQDPSADPDTYLETVEHPLLTEMIDLALSVLSAEAGPQHIKLLLEWSEPEQYFVNYSSLNTIVEHESVARLREQKTPDTVALSLEQCLEHYTKAETLSAEDAWRCPHCQQYLPVVKTLGLWSLPDILVVHFKRFRQHQEKGANAAKLTTMVKFPLTAFDMSPHLAKGNNMENTLAAAVQDAHYRPSPWKKSQKSESRSSTLNSRDNRETRYDLYAVCYHQGDTLETGHYTAACKNPYDRQWYKFDDQRVTKVPEDNIQEEIINNEAYMLFYQRRNAEASECSGSSSNSGDHWVSRIAPLPVPNTNLGVTEEQKVSEESDKIQQEEKTEGDAEKTSLLSVAMATPINESIPTTQVVNVENVEVENETSENVVNKLEEIIDELDFADADIGVGVQDTTKSTTAVPEVAEDQQENAMQNIFEMDEDVALESKESVKSIEHEKGEVVALELENNKQLNGNNEIPAAITNGQKLCSPMNETSAGLNNKNEHNKTVLSSSLKSNSGSIIGATMISHSSHEFRLSHQKLQWNGSRSSVSSAVEHATQSVNVQNGNSGHTLNLRHSFSTSSNYKLRDCNETLSSMLRNSANTCSKDTLIFIDQQNHHHHHHHHHRHHHNHHSLMEDDDDSFMDNRSLWISPVTPHKLITVSPKN